MPLCGFDQQMLEGLREFHEGLARAITRKVDGGTPFKEAIKYELEEIDAFLSEVPNLSDEINRERLLGIARYAKAFYQGALSKGFEREDSESRDFLYSIDRVYYERFGGKKEAMPEFIEFLNNGGT